MDSVLGGGVLLAVAAALWLAYLVPNWLRRSEYLATERNAVRLQQTLRILAETAETPEAVRLENAAKARALEAKLRTQQRPVAVGAPALLEDPLDPRVIAGRRLRRTRIITTVAIVVAAVALLSQIVTALIGGLAAASAVVTVVSAGFLAAGLWLQGRLARAQRRRRPAGSTAVSSQRVVPRPAADSAGYTEVEVDARAWTPRPLPQPLHQVRREAAIRAAADAERQVAAREAEERRVASRVPERAQSQVPERAQSRVPERAQRVEGPERPSTRDVVPRSGTAQRVEGASAPSRFAAMGLVGDVATMPDIDGALARRRAS